MQRKFCKYCFLAVCLLLVPISGLATNHPAYQFRSTSSVNRTGTQTYYGASTPSYSFKTTSSYAPTVSTSVYPVEETSGFSGPRKAKMFNWDDEDSFWDNDPEGADPIGVVPNPLPIGDIPWLLFALAAMAYVVIKKHKSRAVN